MLPRTWRERLFAAALLALAYGMLGQVLVEGESVRFGLTYAAALFGVLVVVLALLAGLALVLKRLGVYRPRTPSQHYDPGE